jgi:hypothetical protein
MTLEQRVRKLERENRWMRRIAAVTVAVVAVVVLVGQGKEDKLPDLEVRSLTVKKGDAHVSLFINKGQPYVQLKDSDGRMRAQLYVSPSICEPVLVLNDQDGRLRASLSLWNGPRLDLYGGKRARGKMLASLSAFKDVPFLRFRDTSETTRALLAHTLQLFDAKGDVIWQAPR